MDTDAPLELHFAVSPAKGVAKLPSPPPAAAPVLRRQSSAPGPAPLEPNGTPDWAALQPAGLYARLGKPLLEGLILALGLPLAALLALPVALANAVAFRSLERVLFAQERIGYRGRRFTLYKFRTMRDTPAGAFASWSEGGDGARVTALGRFLRNSHLDELPQLFNVLRSDMALIGPRPEMADIEQWAEGEIPGFGSRLCVRPGITGWAQVRQGYTGRDVAAYERKFELGLEYAGHLTLGRDLCILCLTARDMLGLRGWRWRKDAQRARDEGSNQTALRN